MPRIPMRPAGSIIDLTLSPTPSPIKRAHKYGVSALDATLERAINLASVEALRCIVVLPNAGYALEKPKESPLKELRAEEGVDSPQVGRSKEMELFSENKRQQRNAAKFNLHSGLSHEPQPDLEEALSFQKLYDEIYPSQGSAQPAPTLYSEMPFGQQHHFKKFPLIPPGPPRNENERSVMIVEKIRTKEMDVANTTV
ncbi:hypothetical protein GLAREA_12684 [Glarea lozoyensis ATCC 20868]|uniref:Uncharacterized protein n=1 Tax=Glarea lozoyensis (strain ATCC 20868 / MF5171) TaxID=1116229 RepID=S3DH86_GLAL2|nr:uncharacterized protein GLAREA_12684 [Glarea lozoyensis ATCC 20868]EPE31381.1 hypothetical protein GLAREA_12684 [Glarea lozoyensis ATCC 20868]